MELNSTLLIVFMALAVSPSPADTSEEDPCRTWAVEGLRLGMNEQQLHEYMRERNEDTVFDRPALRIQFVPRPPVTPGMNDWMGTLWIDRESSQLLRVEAYQGVFADRWNRLQAALERSPAESRSFTHDYDIAAVTVEFGVEVNGMRFPSRVLVDRGHYQVRGGKRRDNLRRCHVASVVHKYCDYRFFHIATEAWIREFVAGES